MILISNGHFKFILGPAAKEVYERGRLSGFITGGYPTGRIKRIVSHLGIDGCNSLKRLLERDESLPDSLVYPLWISELIIQTSKRIGRFQNMAQWVDRVGDSAMALYAAQAKKVVRTSGAMIYHYRSGYGRRSVQVAKDKGMIALCDHSIAHPVVLDFLVANNGRLPEGKIDPPLSKIWSSVLKDIDQANHIVVNSDFVKETFVNQGVIATKINVIYTGVDDAFLNRVPKRIFNKRKNLPVRLMFAGRLSKRKGGHILLQALQQINNLNWELDIIANIDSDIAFKYGNFLSSKKVKVSGFVPISELPKRMSEAEIFIFPSLAEGSARVTFMALACGCYVITTPNSGSIVENGVHGALVPPGDADALTEAIRWAIQQREKLTKIGRQNAELVRSCYRQEHYGNRLVKLYERLLQHREDISSEKNISQPLI